MSIRSQIEEGSSGFDSQMAEILDAAPLIQEKLSVLKPVLKEVAGPVMEALYELAYNHKGFDRIATLTVASRLAEAMLSNPQTIVFGTTNEAVAEKALHIATLIVMGAKE